MDVIVYFHGKEIDRLHVSHKKLKHFKEFDIVKPEEKQWYAKDLHQKTVENVFYRHVVKTGKHHQIVLMSLKPGQDIGLETHPDTDQFIRIESGDGKAIIDGKSYDLGEESAIDISAGSQHNIINTGNIPLKLYTIYSPPHHQSGLLEVEKLIKE